jgi:Rab GDP dissociation inhibitor
MIIHGAIMQVLHLDKNGYYGGDCASLNLTNIYKKFVKPEEPPKEFFDALGSNRDYNIDLVPKFIMANGRLVKILVHTDVTRYLDFKLIEGSYVFRKGTGIGKVPANGVEALKTGLVGFFQVRGEVPRA